MKVPIRLSSVAISGYVGNFTNALPSSCIGIRRMNPYSHSSLDHRCFWLSRVDEGGWEQPLYIEYILNNVQETSISQKSTFRKSPCKLGVIKEQILMDGALPVSYVHSVRAPLQTFLIPIKGKRAQNTH